MTRIDHENLPDQSKSHLLLPFLDPAPYQAAAKARKTGAPPRLLTVAMLRPDVKLQSYRVLSDALKQLEEGSWQLLIVGDGEARDEVRRLFAWADDVAFTGALETEDLPKIYAQADLFVWPAVREGFGMAILEAQASGLPVVAGRALGVPDIVEEGVTGLLAEPEDAKAHAANLKRLIEDAGLRAKMGAAASEKAAAQHSLKGAAETMDAVLRKLRPEP